MSAAAARQSQRRSGWKLALDEIARQRNALLMDAAGAPAKFPSPPAPSTARKVQWDDARNIMRRLRTLHSPPPTFLSEQQPNAPLLPPPNLLQRVREHRVFTPAPATPPGAQRTRPLPPAPPDGYSPPPPLLHQVVPKLNCEDLSGRSEIRDGFCTQINSAKACDALYFDKGDGQLRLCLWDSSEQKCRSRDGSLLYCPPSPSSPPASPRRYSPPPPPSLSSPLSMPSNGTTAIYRPDGTKTVVSPDGFVLRTNPDGTTVSYTPNDTTTVSYPDGTTITNDSNGTTATATIKGPTTGNTTGITAPTNSTTTVTSQESTAIPTTTTTATKPNNSISTTSPNGTHVVSTPDGMTEVTRPDGTTVVTTPDGTITTEIPNGTDTTTQPDGTVIVTDKNGAVTITRPDGKDVTATNGTTVITAPAGTTTTTTPDGTVIVKRGMLYPPRPPMPPAPPDGYPPSPPGGWPLPYRFQPVGPAPPPRIDQAKEAEEGDKPPTPPLPPIPPEGYSPSSPDLTNPAVPPNIYSPAGPTSYDLAAPPTIPPPDRPSLENLAAPPTIPPPGVPSLENLAAPPTIPPPSGSEPIEHVASPIAPAPPLRPPTVQQEEASVVPQQRPSEVDDCTCTDEDQVSTTTIRSANGGAPCMTATFKGCMKQKEAARWRVVAHALAAVECAQECTNLGFCCANTDVGGSNQYLSCAQACMIRVRGGSRPICKAACHQPRACERIVLGETYELCKKCDDVQPSCGDDGVPDAKACEAGCALDILSATSEAVPTQTDPPCTPGSRNCPVTPLAQQAQQSAEESAAATIMGRLKGMLKGKFRRPGLVQGRLAAAVKLYERAREAAENAS